MADRKTSSRMSKKEQAYRDDVVLPLMAEITSQLLRRRPSHPLPFIRAHAERMMSSLGTAGKGHQPANIENALLCNAGPTSMFRDSLYMDDILSNCVQSNTLRTLFEEALREDSGSSPRGEQLAGLEASAGVLAEMFHPHTTEEKVQGVLQAACRVSDNHARISFATFCSCAGQIKDEVIESLMGKSHEAMNDGPGDATDERAPLVTLDATSLRSDQADRLAGLLEEAEIELFRVRVVESRWGLDWEAARAEAEQRCACRVLICDKPRSLDADSFGLSALFFLDAMETVCSGLPCVLVIPQQSKAVNQQQQEEAEQPAAASNVNRQHAYACARLAHAARARGVPVFRVIQDAALYIADVAHRAARFSRVAS